MYNEGMENFVLFFLYTNNKAQATNTTEMYS
jgi:hypothetical protein